VLFLSGFTFVPCRNAKPINPAIAQKASRGSSQFGIFERLIEIFNVQIDGLATT
jgi:hypothetical protein